MLLVFDVGNTNMVLGVYKDKELICNFRIGTDKSKTSDEYGVIIRQLFDYEGISLKNIQDVIINISIRVQERVIKIEKNKVIVSLTYLNGYSLRL